MARNGKNGIGRVDPSRKGRSQRRDPNTGLWSNRVSATGLFTDVKTAGKAFKNVRCER